MQKTKSDTRGGNRQDRVASSRFRPGTRYDRKPLMLDMKKRTAQKFLCCSGCGTHVLDVQRNNWALDPPSPLCYANNAYPRKMPRKHE